MKRVFVFFFLFFPFLTFAVLPPLYTSMEEIMGMLANEGLSKSLQSGESIEMIRRTEDGFEIITNKSQVKVKVNTLPQKIVGPAKFQYQFSQAVPR